MQIQRIQSLFLLLAAVFTGVACFLPYGAFAAINSSVKIPISEAPVLMILNITITVLLIITIFMYNDLRRQIRLVSLDSALIIGSIIANLAYVIAAPGVVVVADSGLAMLVIAFGFTIAARRRIVYDRRLLSSADRLR